MYTDILIQAQKTPLNQSEINASEQYNMGMNCFYGINHDSNLSQSIDYLKKASKHGHPEAKKLLPIIIDLENFFKQHNINGNIFSTDNQKIIIKKLAEKLDHPNIGVINPNNTLSLTKTPICRTHYQVYLNGVNKHDIEKMLSI